MEKHFLVRERPTGRVWYEGNDGAQAESIEQEALKHSTAKYISWEASHLSQWTESPTHHYSKQRQEELGWWGAQWEGVKHSLGQMFG